MFDLYTVITEAQLLPINFVQGILERQNKYPYSSVSHPGIKYKKIVIFR